MLGSTGATVVFLTAPYYQQPEQADGSPGPRTTRPGSTASTPCYARWRPGRADGSWWPGWAPRLDPGGQFAPTIDGVTSDSPMGST